MLRIEKLRVESLRVEELIVDHTSLTSHITHIPLFVAGAAFGDSCSLSVLRRGIFLLSRD